MRHDEYADPYRKEYMKKLEAALREAKGHLEGTAAHWFNYTGMVDCDFSANEHLDKVHAEMNKALAAIDAALETSTKETP